jgi:hypothetical protein
MVSGRTLFLESRLVDLENLNIEMVVLTVNDGEVLRVESTSA